MWKVYKANHYIQGELISEHSTEAAARKKAKKEVGHSYTVKEENKKEILIWLEDKERMAIGIIIKTKKGAKRIRQGKGK
jgi:hypothetical protein